MAKPLLKYQTEIRKTPTCRNSELLQAEGKLRCDIKLSISLPQVAVVVVVGVGVVGGAGTMVGLTRESLKCGKATEGRPASPPWQPFCGD